MLNEVRAIFENFSPLLIHGIHSQRIPAPSQLALTED